MRRTAQLNARNARHARAMFLGARSLVVKHLCKAPGLAPAAGITWAEVFLQEGETIIDVPCNTCGGMVRLRAVILGHYGPPTRRPSGADRTR